MPAFTPAVGEPRPHRVVADHAAPGGKRLDEDSEIRALPVQLEVADPPGGQHQRRPNTHLGVGDPPGRSRAEADLLVHGGAAGYCSTGGTRLIEAEGMDGLSQPQRMLTR